MKGCSKENLDLWMHGYYILKDPFGHWKISDHYDQNSFFSKSKVKRWVLTYWETLKIHKDEGWLAEVSRNWL